MTIFDEYTYKSVRSMNVLYYDGEVTEGSSGVLEV